MDAYVAIVSKREVRAYDDRPISDDARRRILEAGRLAGSSRNRQNRRFVVLADRDMIGRAAATVYNPDNLVGAQVVVVVIVRGKGPVAFDAGRAAQNMMLAAWADGIGSCPNGVADSDGLGELIGRAADEEVVIVLGFGHPFRPVDPGSRSADEWIAAANRRPVEDVVEVRGVPVVDGLPKNSYEDRQSVLFRTFCLHGASTPLRVRGVPVVDGSPEMSYDHRQVVPLRTIYRSPSAPADATPTRSREPRVNVGRSPAGLSGS